MNLSKIENAVERLERNLPIRHNQARLPESLRRLHRWILRYFLENGVAPGTGDLGDVDDWQGGIDRLAAEHIIVVDDKGAITGAYPFINEGRGFRVITNCGAVNAMCAFDALAVSSMFAIPTLIESCCRLSGQAIMIEQDRADIRVSAPAEPVFAVIDWNAAVGASSCSATLCTEMIFIAGEERTANWCSEDSDNRELFDLPEAHALITTVFVPLMQ
jgi:hypothetical protein